MILGDDGSPAVNKKSFICPCCDVHTSQTWETWKGHATSQYPDRVKLKLAKCYRCNIHSVWKGDRMIYPPKSLVLKANDSMPEDVKEIYEEARLVSIYSPRAAAALLRLALEKLTPHLGESEGKLNTRIGNLQKKNTFDARVIKCLDIIRITANEGGAHDGLMDLTGAEGAKTVNNLFFAINYIVEKTITEPAKLDQMYGKLPQGKLDGIKNRDKPTPGKKIQ